MQLALIVAFVPETYHPVILRRKAIAFRAQTGEQRWHAPIEKLDRSVVSTVMWSCIRPFQLLFLEPMVSVIFFFFFICHVNASHNSSARLRWTRMNEILWFIS